MGSETADVDALFVRFCRTGDPRALGEAYDRVAPELFRIALHTTRDVAQAEDVLQATFVAAIERRASFDLRQRAMPWLVGILANEAKRARERAQREIDPARVDSGRAPTPDTDAERAELAERLDEALAKLPAAFRPVLVLRFKHDLNAGEIAEALGIPPGTVRSQLARGTEQLRRHLPAGLAGAWLASLSQPSRGLELVREAVVAHAMALQPTVAVSVALSGVLAMKKVLLASAAAAVLATAWIAWPQTNPAKPTSSDDVARAAVPQLEDVVASTQPTSDGAREVASDRVTARTSEMEASAHSKSLDTATLLVRALEPDGTTPAVGEIVLVQTGTMPDDSISRSTDLTGCARFEDLPPRAVYVRLLRGAERSVGLTAGRTTSVELGIRAGFVVEGAVRDANGRGLGGAELWLSERYRTNNGYVLARTDSHGRFRLSDVGPDHFLAARADGYAISGSRAVRAAPGDVLHIDFVLRTVATHVRGFVRDDRGEPVSGARVLIGDELPQPGERFDDGSTGFGPPPQRATTDEQGAFAVEHTPLGLAAVQVRASGFAPFAGEFPFTGAEDALEITLHREARVVGRVIDASGSAASSAVVRTGDADRFAASFAFTRLDGGFVLAGLPAGAVHLVAERRDSGRAEIDLVLTAGATVEWNARLQRELGISGHVLDHDRKPLDGWTVVALPGGDPSRRLRSRVTDAEGAFAIDELDDEPHTLWIQGHGGLRAFPESIVGDVRPSSLPLELIVPENDVSTARIVARVLSPTREPVAGAELQLWHERAKLWRSFVADGATGLIEIAHVPPGAVELDLRHAEFPWVHIGRRQLAAGETLDLGEIVLSEPGRLRAHLRGVDATTLSGVRAMLTDSSNRESGVARVEADGELRSGPLAPGRHTLVLRGDSLRLVQVAFEAVAGVETELDVALERCSMRRVVFEMPADAARPHWLSCSAHDASGGQPWFDSVGAEGPLEARVSLPRGDYRFVARGEDGWAADAELTIDDGLAPLVLRLSKP